MEWNEEENDALWQKWLEDEAKDTHADYGGELREEHESKAFKADPSLSVTEAAAYEQGAEAMRAACWEAVQRVCEEQGLAPFAERFKTAIEGAAS